MMLHFGKCILIVFPHKLYGDLSGCGSVSDINISKTDGEGSD